MTSDVSDDHSITWRHTLDKGSPFRILTLNHKMPVDTWNHPSRRRHPPSELREGAP